MAMTSELLALQLMCKNYESGLKGMADVLGISADLLGKKLRNDQGHVLNPTEVGMIIEACIRKNTEHCMAFINCATGSAGMTLTRLPVIEMKSCVAETAASVTEEMADMAASMFRYIADDSISDNEMKLLEKNAHEAMAAIQLGLEACRAKHKAGKQ